MLCFISYQLGHILFPLDAILFHRRTTNSFFSFAINPTIFIVVSGSPLCFFALECNHSVLTKKKRRNVITLFDKKKERNVITLFDKKKQERNVITLKVIYNNLKKCHIY